MSGGTSLVALAWSQCEIKYSLLYPLARSNGTITREVLHSGQSSTIQPHLSLSGFPHNYQLQVQDDHLIARGEPNRYVFQGCVWYRFNEALGCTRTRGRRSTDSSTPDPALPPQLPWSPFPLSLAAPPSSPCRSPSPHPLSQLPTPGSSMMAARRTSSNVGWHHCARKDSFLSIWWRFEKFVNTSKMQRRTRCSLSQHRS